MKWWSLEVALAALVSAAVCSAAAAGPREQQKPLWHTNYEEAKSVARTEGKPLFVVFR